VLHEGADVLRLTLPTWASSCRELGCDVVFVDNSWSDEPASVVREQDWGDCRVEIIRDATNPGFAASANRAIAASDQGQVFLLNADVYLDPRSLSMAAEADPKAGPVAVSLVTGGTKTSGISIDRLGYFSDRRSSSSLACLGPSGGAAIYDREDFLASGGFTADLFAWGEDAGLALRQWARGVRPQELDLGLEHVGGHSVASLAGLRFKARLLSRNRVRIIRRQYSRPLAFTLGVLQVLVMIVNGLRKIPAGTARPHFLGLTDGLLERNVRVDRASRFDARAYRAYRQASSLVRRRG
jgi:N-acetylglucosaminyl-diphospho-decaprenol L-rhamnosyltransferase